MENFGCGSSREHAPWALTDFGIKVIIAKSFADIFYNNCFKNAILPIKLSGDKVQKIIDLSKKKKLELEVDLENQTIIGPQLNFSFEIDKYKKTCLLKGWDDIDLTLKKENLISEFETKNKKSWLEPPGEKMNKIYNVSLLPGDGIGQEISTEASKVLEWFNEKTDLKIKSKKN